MKNLTVRQRILGSFVGILAAMAIMGGVAYSQLSVIARDVNWLQSDQLPGLNQSSQMLTFLQGSYALIGRHVNEIDRTRMDGLVTELRLNTEAFQNIERPYVATLFGDEDRRKYEAFRSVHEPYQRWVDQVVALSVDPKTKSAARALLRTRVDPDYEKARAALEVMVAFNRQNADGTTAGIKAAVGSAYVGILVTFGIAVFLALLNGYLLARDLTSQLKNVARIADQIAAGDLAVSSTAGTRKDEIGLLALAFDRMVASLKNAARAAESIAAGNLSVGIKLQSPKDVMGIALTNMVANLSTLIGQVQKSGIAVNTSVTEIAATAKQQQATASETAATVTEISATSIEISATSRELVKTMNEVSTVAEQTAQLASGSQASLSHMEETMHSVMEAGASINDKLTILSEKAGNINAVVTTITRVADQTNLLSLNAAIEAEKAGDYGRGFSVVATEIRRLADQTAVATYDIEQMVKEILSAVSAGVMGMDKFSEAVRRGMEEVGQIGVQLTQIVQQVQALAPRVEAVNEGMQAQATGAEQITQALTLLTEAAQQTVDSLQFSRAAVEDLNKVSTGLRTGVSTFVLQA